MGKWGCVVKLLKESGYELNLNRFKDKLLLQKLVYIAQKIFSIKLDYKFSWYHYGPYSRGLAIDAGRYGLEYQGKCDIDMVKLTKFVKFINEVNNFGDLNYWAELIASYVMLNNDVYPKPKDPVKELVTKKKYIKIKDVYKGIELLKKVNV